MCKRLHFLYTLLLLSICVRAQDIRFEYLTSQHGLSQNSVNGVLQDYQGFIWISTREGLNRYDGYDFKVYQNDPIDSLSLSNNHIRYMFEDSNKTLWLCTSGGGINKFNRPKQQFTAFRYNSSNKNSISSNNVSSMCEDKSGMFWVGTSDGLNYFNPGTGNFTRYKHTPGQANSLSNNDILTLHIDKEGIVWIGSRGGLDKYNPVTRLFTHIPLNNIQNNYLREPVVDRIYEDKTGTLWIATFGDGLKKMVDKNSGQVISYEHNPADPSSISDNYVVCITEDSFGGLWLGTFAGGLNKLDRTTGKFTSYKEDNNNIGSISDNYVLSVYEDRSKVLWVGTFGGGINTYDRTRIKFVNYKASTTAANSLKDKNVHGLYESRSGDLWIGTHKGVEKLDRKTGIFTRYDYDARELVSLGSNPTYGMYEDRYGMMWMCVNGSGLVTLNPLTGVFTWFKHNPEDENSLSNNKTICVYEDREGVIWVGTENGLNKLDQSTGKFERFWPEKQYFHSNNTYVVACIYEDLAGTLYIGTGDQGLASFDRKKGTFTHYPYNTDYPVKGNNTNIIFIHEDWAQRLWVSFNGNVLHRFDRKQEKFIPISSKEGLPANVVRGILEDNKGNLWLSTRKGGLFKYNPDTKTHQRYDVSNGLHTNEFSGACFKNKQGEMFFGGTCGFSVFHPDSIQKNTYISPVVITRFRIFDEEVENFDPAGIEVDQHKNFFAFDFAALSYSMPEKNQYAYKLEGFDKDWVQSKERRYASYTNLDPGEYTFRVKGSNYDGVWNEEGTSAKVIIKPPYWKTIGFKTLVSSILLLIAYIGYRARIKVVEMQKEKLENLVVQRTEELKQKSIQLERNSLTIASQRDELQSKNKQLGVALAEAEKQRKMAEEANRVKTEFLSIAVHDLKNPLGGFLLYAELIKESVHNPDKVIRFADVIKTTSESMFNLVSNLLKTVRLQSGEMMPEKVLSDIAALAEDTVDKNMLQAQHKQQTLSLVTRDNCLAFVDPELVREIFANLVSNAIKFSPKESTIYVNVQQKDNIVQIQVEDQGEGLSKEDMKKMFRKFQRLSAQPTNGESSTGLGLSIVKKLVDLHDGKVWAESKGKGKGCTFFVEIPVESSNQQAAISHQ